MNYKRKRSRKQVRCTMCTWWSWMGNKAGRRPVRDHSQEQEYRRFRRGEVWA